MNLLSLTAFQFLTRQFTNFSRVAMPLSICFMIITSSSVHAFDLDIDSSYSNEVTTSLSNKLTYRNLVNGSLIAKLPSLMVFKTRDVAYLVEEIKNQYLTYYFKKNKKVNATFDSGAYRIKYTHNW